MPDLTAFVQDQRACHDSTSQEHLLLSLDVLVSLREARRMALVPLSCTSILESGEGMVSAEAIATRSSTTLWYPS